MRERRPNLATFVMNAAARRASVLLVCATSMAIGFSACSESGGGRAPTAATAEVESTSESPRWLDGGTFAGTLPCASCPGIETMLQLREDGTFFLSSTYIEAEGGEDRGFNDIGRWSVTADRSMLILRGGTEGARRFEILDADTIRQLNNLGEPIRSDLSYELVRTTNEDFLSGDVRLSGMYLYMADAAILDECRSRTRYPVAIEGAHIDLERAYLAERSEPGAPLLARFTGAIEMRPRMEGGGERPFVTVSAFGSVSPGETCYDRTPPIGQTNWQLIELLGLPVDQGASNARPSIVLDPASGRVAGNGGCNQISGGFRLTPDSLVLGRMAVTMMACPEGMEQEAAFLRALEAATTYQHYGPFLELWSADGFLARFEGVEIED